jgi:hypothetical protein
MRTVDTFKLILTFGNSLIVRPFNLPQFKLILFVFLIHRQQLLPMDQFERSRYDYKTPDPFEHESLLV